MQSQERNQVHTPDLAEDKRKGKALTVSIHIGGKRVDKLTTEQCERMAQRLSKTMSVYYSSHNEEYGRIKN